MKLIHISLTFSKFCCELQQVRYSVEDKGWFFYRLVVACGIPEIPISNWSNNKQSQLCVDILEQYGTYYKQCRFRNGTMFLQAVKWAEVPFVAEVVMQLKFDNRDKSLSTWLRQSMLISECG